MLNDSMTQTLLQWIAVIVIWLLASRLHKRMQKWLCGPSRFDIQITEGQSEATAEHTGMSSTQSRLTLIGGFLVVATTVFGYLMVSGVDGAPVWALFALISATAASGVLMQAATTFSNVHRVLSIEPEAKIRTLSSDSFEVRCDRQCLGVGATPERAWGEAWRRLCTDRTAVLANQTDQGI